MSVVNFEIKKKDRGLVKLIDSASFFKDDTDPVVSVLDISNPKDSLVKAAADKRIDAFVSDLEPIEGKMYLHINAMGAGEYYGSNKNGDYFPEENLRAYFKTFETTPAHFYRHHINKDPAKANGKVIYAIYNERMHRVELIVEVDRVLASDIEAKIATGEYPLTSMACKTPFDICSICGNKARTRQEYCTHLVNELNEIRPDGRKVMAINSGPLAFFDISYVIRPADVTSSILTKVANEISGAVSSAELAEEEGLSWSTEGQHLKQATLKKISELIKVVDDGQIIDASGSLSKLLSKVEDPDTSIVATLSKFPWNDVLNAFAEAGVNPSIRFLCEFIMQKYLGDEGRGLGTMLAELILRVHPADIPSESIDYIPEIVNIPSNPILRNVVMRMKENSSLSEAYVEKRASYGYASWDGNMRDAPLYLSGPTLSNEELELQMKQRGLLTNSSQGQSGPGMLTTLLTMGGMAIAARFFISSLMDQKFSDLEKNLNQANQAKLGIVKSAESVLSDLGTFLIYSNSNKDGKLIKSADYNLEREGRGQTVTAESSENKLEHHNKALTALKSALLHSHNPKAQSAGRALTLAGKLAPTEHSGR